MSAKDNKYDVDIILGHSQKNNEIIDFLAEKITGKWLDVGCNSGQLLLLVPNGEGIDLSKEMVKRAIEKGCKAQHADGQDLPYTEKLFDTVVLGCVLEQAEDWRKMLKEALRVCKPTGRVIGINPIPEASPWGFLGGTKWVQSVIHYNELELNYGAKTEWFDHERYYFEIQHPKTYVYSAIFGGFDNLIEQPKQDNVEYHLFTDNQTLKDTETWHVHHEDSRYPDHPRLSAKWHKMHPYDLFPNQYTIWIDGSIQITNDKFASYYLANMKKGMCQHIHPVRRSVHREVSYSYGMKKDPQGNPYRIDIQLENYRKLGFPDKQGLYACGLLCRGPHDTKWQELHKEWWEECTQYIQDQISYPYLLWKYGLTPSIIKTSIYANDYFVLKLHNN